MDAPPISPLRRAALDPQLDLCRDRQECASWKPAKKPFGATVPAQIALLASVLACLVQANR